MTGFLDGEPVDLNRVQVALDGSRWLWTCEVSESGEPLMHRLGRPGARSVPLSEVYVDHGPLVSARQPTTAAECRQVLEAA